MPRTQRLTSMLVVAYAVAGLTGCDGGTGPSAMPQVEQGSHFLPATSLTAVFFKIERQGTLTSVVSWNNFFNDIDSGLLRGTCTPDQVQADVAGCRVEEDTLGFDGTTRNPSRFDAPVTPGVHTLLLYNFGIRADRAFYRLEIN